MTKLTLLKSVPTAALLGLLAACQTTQNPGAYSFNDVDANHDGKVSREEFNDYFVTRIFNARDTNHDGKITWAEWNIQGANLDKSTFTKRDANKDGVVTLEEAKAYGLKNGVYSKAFDEADTNKDGFVTPAEAKAYYAKREGPAN